MVVRYAIAVLLGLLIYHLFFKPKISERVEVVETFKVDTVYLYVRDTIRINRTRVQIEYVTDTVIEKQSFPINRFTGLESTLYGDIGYTGLVAGHFLNLQLNTNLKFPTLETTINREKTVTRVIKARGLYVGGSVSDQIQYSAGASYLDNVWLFDYRYDVGLGSHSIGIKRKIF